MSVLKPRPPSAFEFKEILYEKGDGLARVTLNRPKAYNAYSTGALQELITAFRDAAFDDSVWVIVYTGSGDRAFCTGGDVKEYEDLYLKKPRDYWKYMSLFRGYLESILDCGKPVIGRLNGMAVGGGNESQLACDIVIAGEHAYLKQVGIHVGSVACGGATQWLPLAIGDRRARRMLMLGEKVPARTALEWGLISDVVPSVKRGDEFVKGATDEQIRLAQAGRDGYSIDLSLLDQRVNETAHKLFESFPECMRYTKRQVNFLKDFTWHETVGHAQDWLSLHFTCHEPLEGMRAFVEKRPPKYLEIRKEAAEGGSPEFPWGHYGGKCGSCGTVALPTGFKFCGACGARLG
ncbi:MAG TPA: enoyl-CoA hydratase/isomerase family protein [Candidatus Saccharimonadales bacterium]|nr:enoyl-CoA hydratase/isomerase family protein [Candidatus Saccharimonadales bacterium]